MYNNYLIILSKLNGFKLFKYSVLCCNIKITLLKNIKPGSTKSTKSERNQYLNVENPRTIQRNNRENTQERRARFYNEIS